MAELTVRVVISLAVVLGLFWLVARTGSRRIGGRDRGLLRVRGRQALSRGSSLAVVEVGARVLVVGVSDSGVRLLTELDPLELESAVPTAQDTDQVSDYDTVAAGYAPAATRPVRAAVGVTQSADFVPALYQSAEPTPATRTAERTPEASRSAGQRGSHRASRPASRRAARHAARTHRAAPRASGRRAGQDVTSQGFSGPDGTALGGSLLAPATWRQAWAAATGRVAETAPGVSGDAA